MNGNDNKDKKPTTTAIAVVAALVVAEAPVFGHRLHHHCRRGYGVLSGNHRPAVAVGWSVTCPVLCCRHCSRSGCSSSSSSLSPPNTLLYRVALVDSCVAGWPWPSSSSLSPLVNVFVSSTLSSSHIINRRRRRLRPLSNDHQQHRHRQPRCRPSCPFHGHC